tara:strand:+ start:391 stop:606 length:216 start_codon:yes stop_codon:yes gene_type:complete
MKISKARLLQIIKEELNEVDREELIATNKAEQEIAMLEEKIQEMQNRIDYLRMNIASGKKTQHDIDRGANE